MQASRPLSKQLLLSAQDSPPGASASGYRTQRPNRVDSKPIPDVWRSARLLGTLLGIRQANQSKAPFSGDEEIQPKSPNLQGLQDLYDRFKAQQADLPKPDFWKSCLSSQSALGIRYHICAHQNVLCIFGCDSGHLFKEGCRLGHLQKDQQSALFGGS